MTKKDQITAWVTLGQYMKETPQRPLSEKIQEAYAHNPWFIPAHCHFALNALATWLQEECLHAWLSAYHALPVKKPKRIGIIMPGNIPLVGFHDLLCVLAAGHIAIIKLSAKDNILLPHLTEKLITIESRFQQSIYYTTLLKDIDAIIATGSNSSRQYFEYYFSKYPHIIRGHRNAVAVLTGEETAEEMTALGQDIFLYFGLGCRNVSKIYIPQGYPLRNIFNSLQSFKEVMEHRKYRNNYDYNLALLLVNKIPHLASDFLLLRETDAIASPVAMLHYEYYNSVEELEKKLMQQRHFIQCVVAKKDYAGFSHVPFGKTQQPELWDYADGVDTMQFLTTV